MYLGCDDKNKFAAKDCGFNALLVSHTFKFVPIDGLIDTYNLQSITKPGNWLNLSKPNSTKT
jgi:hypothetical protein